MMKREADIAIIGATGLIGEALLDLIAEHAWLKGQVQLLGGDAAHGEFVDFGGKDLIVEDVVDYGFNPDQIVISTGEEELNKEWLQRAQEAGAIVLDLGAKLLPQYDLPPVVAGVNSQVIEAVANGGIIALPDAATVQLASVLKPILDWVDLKSVSVVSCHAVSDMGRSGVEEMARQTAQLLNAKSISSLVFDKQIAFNLIPTVGKLVTNGLTDVERSIINGTRRVLDQPELDLAVSCCWVPVFFGHSQAVHLRFETTYAMTELANRLTENPRIRFFNTSDSYPTAVTEASGKNDVMVGRLIAEKDKSQNFTLWTFADNLRFGIAGNALKTVEILVKDCL